MKQRHHNHYSDKNFYDILEGLYDLDIYDDVVSQQENGNANMEKKFHILKTESFSYKTYEEAEKAAKQAVAKYDQGYAVVQAVAHAVVPTPEIEIVKVS